MIMAVDLMTVVLVVQSLKRSANGEWTVTLEFQLAMKKNIKALSICWTIHEYISSAECFDELRV